MNRRVCQLDCSLTLSFICRKCPDVQIFVRADSGFCRENFDVWGAQTTAIDDLLGLMKNSRPGGKIKLELELAKAESAATGKSAGLSFVL